MFTSPFLMATSPLNRLFYLFKSHILFMYATIDPMNSIDAESQRMKFSGSRRKHSFYSLSVVLFATFYGIYGFQLEAGLPLDAHSLANSSAIFSHQVVPRVIWHQIDFALAIDIAATVAILVVFSIDKPVANRFKLSKCVGLKTIYSGQTVILTGDDFTEIVKFQTRWKGAALMFIDFFYVSVMTAFMANVLFTNGAYSTSLTSIIYWTFVFPTNIFYYCSSILGSVIYTLLTSNYIVIWQKAVYAKTLKKVAVYEKTLSKDHLEHLGQSRHSEFTQEQARLLSLLYFRSFMAQNGRWNEICATLSEYSRLCQPLLSTIFPFIITIQCYLLYIILLTEIPPFFKYVCIMTICEFNLFLLVVTNQCARVVTLNKRFYGLNRHFYINLKRANALHGHYLVKAEMLQDHGRFGPFGFRLAGNYRITNSTFNAIVTYISIFFMFLVKNAYKEKYNMEN